MENSEATIEQRWNEEGRMSWCVVVGEKVYPFRYKWAAELAIILERELDEGYIRYDPATYPMYKENPLERTGN